MLRLRSTVLLCALLPGAGLAHAQKTSGKVKCPKPSASHSLSVPGHPDHVFAINQSTGCTWTKPMTIGGVKNKEGADTSFSEINGNTLKVHGVWIDTMANGDKGTYLYDGTATLKNGVMQSAEDNWFFTDGTGKLKGVKGSGSCKGKGTPDGGATWDCEGTYTPAAGK